MLTKRRSHRVALEHAEGCLASAHATLDPPGPVSAPTQAGALSGGAQLDLVVRAEALAARRGEPITNLHTLDCLDAHERGGQAAIEAPVPVHVAAEAGRQAIPGHLDNTADGCTLGGPVAVRVANTEWPKWQQVMSADPVCPDALAGQARNAPLSRPRPGHADLAGMQKYGATDARPILERASARETAARVALGEVARAFLRQAFGIEIVSHVIALGTVAVPNGVLPSPQDLARVDADPVRCADPPTSTAMVAEIDAARKDGDTLACRTPAAISTSSCSNFIRAPRP